MQNVFKEIISSVVPLQRDLSLDQILSFDCSAPIHEGLAEQGVSGDALLPNMVHLKYIPALCP